MDLELVSIPTDTDPLDGLYYTPSGRPTRGAVLLFHGNAMNFYTGPPRFLPPELVAAGFACLAFNRRGHDILATRSGRDPTGGAYQTAAQGIEDNEAAARWLADRGFPRPVVIGHSNGGLLAARFAADHPELSALVLLSAHAGGPDSVVRSSRAGLLAGQRVDECLAEASRLVADGRGDELLLLPHWWYVISAESLLDRHQQTPDLLADATRVRCPTLFVVAEQEPPRIYPASAFAERAGGTVEVHVIPETDHWYNGRNDEVAELVTGWVVRQG